MPTCLQKSTVAFLSDLQKNNNREWFAENKNRYEEAKQDFEEFVGDLLKGIVEFDPNLSHLEAKKCIFRIYRDVRFSKDKSPYKTHFSAHFTPASSKSDIHSLAGYYIGLGPGENIIAGGAYQPNATWLAKIRQEIDYNSKDFKTVIENKDFKEIFGNLQGEKLKRPPKGYNLDNPNIEFLKHKAMFASRSIEDKVITQPTLLTECLRSFKALKPLGDFLNRD